MTVDEINYGALLGVEDELAALSKAESEGEKEPAAAEPASDESAGEPADEDGGEQDAQGEKEPEAADPADESTVEETKQDASAQDASAQDAQTNARFAAARRRAEADADERVRQAREDAAKQVDAAIAELGLSNPYTGKPVSTKAELDAMRARQAQDRRETIARKAGLSDEELNEFVQSQPEVIEAKRAREAAAREQARRTIDAEVEKITGLDPEIRSAADITRHASYRQVYELVGKGYALSDAWRLANFDRLAGRAARAAQQEARNEARAVGHLQRSAQRQTGTVDVPADIAAEYRQLMPTATDEEIKAHYNKYLKSKG